MPEQIFYQHPKLPGLELRYGDDNRACYGLHTHSEYSLGAVLNGNAIYQYRRQTYAIGRGDTLLIAPNVPHSCNLAEPTEKHNNESWRYLMLYISANYWQQSAEHLSVATSLFLADGTPQRNSARFCAIMHLHRVWQTMPDNALAIETAWLDCFQQLAQRGVKRGEKNPDNPPAELSLKRALTWLDEHLSENISLNEWANAVGIHRVQLLRLFRRQLHISPHQYYLNRRIQQAKILLKQGTPLDETAYELGFADQAHFQRTFKRYTAVTPRQYQKNR